MTLLSNDGSRSRNEEEDKTLKGMIIVGLATGLFVGAGATVQYVGGSVLQLVMGSYFFQNIFSILYWKFKKPRSVTNWYGDSPNKFNVWIRGLLFWIEQFCWYKGLEMVPIGNAEAIIFLSPLLTVILARVLLKETLPRLFPVTLTMTMLGLIFIAQPGFLFSSTSSDSNTDEANWFGVLFLILCVGAWTGASLLVRTAPDAHWLQINLVSSFQAAYVLTPMLAIINHIIISNNSNMHSGEGNGTPASNAGMSFDSVPWIDANDFGDWDWSAGTIFAMILAAIFEWFAIVGKIVGYQYGEATKVAWMEYFDVVFAFICQCLLFKRIPNTYEFIGGILLVFTCIVSFLEEKLFPSKSKKGNKGDGSNRGGGGGGDRMNSMDDDYSENYMVDADVPLTEINPLLNSNNHNNNNNNNNNGSDDDESEISLGFNNNSNMAQYGTV